MRGTIFFIVLAALVLVGIFSLLRSRRLKEKYAALWVVVGVVLIVLAAWPALLGFLANAVGIQVPANLLFTLAIVLLLAIVLHLSLELSGQEDKIRRLAEEAAIAREQIQRLNERDSADGTPLTGSESPVSDTYRQVSTSSTSAGDADGE